MKLSIALLLIPTVCYSGISANEAWQGHWPQALVFFGYALANTGLMVTL
jgi:hypothetical protein